MRFLCPWDSPDKNTGEGCHSLLQGIFPTQGSKSPKLTSRFFTTSATYETPGIKANLIWPSSRLFFSSIAQPRLPAYQVVSWKGNKLITSHVNQFNVLIVQPVIMCFCLKMSPYLNIRADLGSTYYNLLFIDQKTDSQKIKMPFPLVSRINTDPTSLTSCFNAPTMLLHDPLWRLWLS